MSPGLCCPVIGGVIRETEMIVDPNVHQVYVGVWIGIEFLQFEGARDFKVIVDRKVTIVLLELTRTIHDSVTDPALESFRIEREGVADHHGHLVGIFFLIERQGESTI